MRGQGSNLHEGFAHLSQSQETYQLVDRAMGCRVRVERTRDEDHNLAPRRLASDTWLPVEDSSPD